MFFVSLNCILNCITTIESFFQYCGKGTRDGANFLMLLEQSMKWKQAQILNGYTADIEKTANLSGKFTDELKDKQSWARDKA